MQNPGASPADEDDEDGEIDGYREHPLKHFFDVPIPPWRPDSEAPPVDREKLKELFQNVLSREESPPLWDNILRFRCWARAYCELMAEEYRRRKPD